MGSQQMAFTGLFLLALVLITVGFQGNLGTCVGILFAPSHIVIEES